MPEDAIVTETRPLRYAILGAGMAGLLAGVKLLERGETDFTIYEKGDSVGGTWRENRYPGLTCDFPSHNYSYSFAPNPEWSSTFSPGPEIHRYFQKIADDYGVSNHIRFRCEVKSCRFSDGRWEIYLADGSRDIVDIVIAATGVLHHPNIPDIPGMDSFAGTSFHSARWPDDLVWQGARVGVIGSGSTGVQLVGAMAEEAGRLVHFNRTPQWMMPSQNPPFTDEQRAAFRADPARIEAIRNDPQLLDFFGKISRALTDASDPFLEQLQAICENHLATVKDPDLRERLRPDHRAGCKRLVLTTDYYQKIQQDNVSLERAPIERLEPEGVRMADGSFHSLDILIFATGFRVDRFVRPIAVVGGGDLALDAVWGQHPTAYLAITVPGFPNFFMLNGPSGPVGNVSLIEIAEEQWRYIDQLIEPLRRSHYTTVEPRPEVLVRFERERAEAAKKTIWASGCKSWYLDAEGTPTTWPWTFAYFKAQMAQPRFEEYSWR